MNHTTKLTQFEVIRLRLAEGSLSVDPDTGIVYCHRTNSSKQFTKCVRNGYAFIGISFRSQKYNIFVHRLMWFACVGDIPNDLQVDHINKNRSDNRLCNLRVVTPQENLEHRDLSNAPKGEDQLHSKLTEVEVIQIRDLYAYGYGSYRAIGELYNVHTVTVHNIIRRVTWKHI